MTERTADTPIVVNLGAAELLATLTAVRVMIQDLEPDLDAEGDLGQEMVLRLRLAERRLVLAMLVGTGFDADTIAWP